ncbi:PREDICTED: uncharacterized protein LOC109234496 isoform X2 [Nicotiana attenuata]|nr:PREDICTED: uncharacterized protein LOC109234496 isoform X2 [Nicotiana attenuata]
MIDCLKEETMIFYPWSGSSREPVETDSCKDAGACPQISGGSLQPWRRRISFCLSYNRDLSLKTVIGSIQLDRSRGDFAQIGCFEATIYILLRALQLVLSEYKPKAKIIELCRKDDAFIRG